MQVYAINGNIQARNLKSNSSLNQKTNKVGVNKNNSVAPAFKGTTLDTINDFLNANPWTIVPLSLIPVAALIFIQAKRGKLRLSDSFDVPDMMVGPEKK